MFKKTNFFLTLLITIPFSLRSSIHDDTCCCGDSDVCEIFERCPVCKKMDCDCNNHDDTDHNDGDDEDSD